MYQQHLIRGRHDVMNKMNCIELSSNVTYTTPNTALQRLNFVFMSYLNYTNKWLFMYLKCIYLFFIRLGDKLEYKPVK